LIQKIVKDKIKEIDKIDEDFFKDFSLSNPFLEQINKIFEQLIDNLDEILKHINIPKDLKTDFPNEFDPEDIEEIMEEIGDNFEIVDVNEGIKFEQKRRLEGKKRKIKI